MPTCKRFHPGGDASVLPFGITCINVTAMMAKFLMLAKATDKMEALMSQKPFWRMFADPNAILALQELSMIMLCDVVTEMNRERKIPAINKKANISDMPGGCASDEVRPVTVFDFTEVLDRTERRVRDDLLGAGPQTVDELRSIAGRLGLKYQQQLEMKEKRGAGGKAPPSNMAGSAVAGASNMAGSAVAGASNMAVGMFSKIKSTRPPNFSMTGRKEAPVAVVPTIVDLPPMTPTKSEPVDLLNTPVQDLLNTPFEGEEGSWHGVSNADMLPSPPPSASSHFSIDDDDDI